MTTRPNPQVTPESTNPGVKAVSSGSLGRQIVAELDRITLEKVAEIGFKNAQANAPLIAKGKSILALRNTLLKESRDALIIAAGPSLQRYDAAKHIKEAGFQGVIVTTESAWCKVALQDFSHRMPLPCSLGPYPSPISSHTSCSLPGSTRRGRVRSLRPQADSEYTYPLSR